MNHQYHYCFYLGKVALEKNKNSVAISYFNIGCEMFNAQSCYELGLLSESEASKEEFFRKSCYNGYGKGCGKIRDMAIKNNNLIQADKYDYLKCYVSGGLSLCGEMPAGLDESFFEYIDPENRKKRDQTD